MYSLIRCPLKSCHFTLRTAEYASSVEHEPVDIGTTTAYCVRIVSKTRILLCAAQCVLASWTLSITKTYCFVRLVRGKIVVDLITFLDTIEKIT